jgi:aldehyde dehydrogenase (NAD+)
MTSDVAAPLSTASDACSRILAVFQGQRATALRLRSSTAAERIAKIRRLRDVFIANTPAWYEAGHADFKKPPGEVDLAEILPVVIEANNAIRNLKSWMKPTRVRPTLLLAGTSGSIQYEPRGRCPTPAPVRVLLAPTPDGTSNREQCETP